MFDQKVLLHMNSKRILEKALLQWKLYYVYKINKSDILYSVVTPVPNTHYLWNAYLTYMIPRRFGFYMPC